MKKFILLRFALCFLTITTINSYGVSLHNPTTLPNNEVLKYLRGSEVVKLSARQLMELTGKKMNLWEKVSFGIMKVKIKHDLKKYPNLTLKDYYSNKIKNRLGTIWWILIGIAGVLLLAIVIFIIAYSGGGD